MNDEKFPKRNLNGLESIFLRHQLLDMNFINYLPFVESWRNSRRISPKFTTKHLWNSRVVCKMAFSKIYGEKLWPKYWNLEKMRLFSPEALKSDKKYSFFRILPIPPIFMFRFCYRKFKNVCCCLCASYVLK
jgi:hypothetical protein